MSNSLIRYAFVSSSSFFLSFCFTNSSRHMRLSFPLKSVRGIFPRGCTLLRLLFRLLFVLLAFFLFFLSLSLFLIVL